MNELKLVIDQTDDLVTVAVAGELDLHTAPGLRGALTELVTANPGCDLQIDLNEVSFMDSSGLSALIAAHKEAIENGGQLVVRHPADMVSRMLSVTGLDKVMPVLGRAVG